MQIVGFPMGRLIYIAWRCFHNWFQNVGKLLYESREVVKSQQFEIDDLKQKLTDAQGDIKVMVEKERQ